LYRPLGSKGLTYTLLILGAVVLLSIPSAVRSQFIPCNIVNVSVTHPDSVPEGQALQVMTSITSSCDPSAFYVLRVDLVDQRSGTVLSSVKLPYYPTASSVSGPINNTATAPSSIGPWVLQSQVYLINGINGQVAASSQQQFVVNITQYTPQTATTAVFSAGNTTHASAFFTFSNQTVLSSATSTFSLMPTFATGEATVQPTNSAIEALTLLLLGGAGVFFFVMWRKRSPPAQPQAQPKVNYCTQCGAKLIGNGSVCRKCGARL
jgi:hypothetical protein